MPSASQLPAVSLAPIVDYDCRVLFNRPAGTGLYRLRLQALNAPFACAPGQFVMVDLPERGFHFRRPFSLLCVLPDNQFDLYYKVVGTGTRLMQTLQPGDSLRCLGALGLTFPEPQVSEKALYIGGGIGIAPLYFLAQTYPNAQSQCFYGVRSVSEIGLEGDLQTIFGGKLQITTDDGSYGHAGNVCTLLAEQPETIRAATRAYICGPTRMMQAACELLCRINPGIEILVSLEEHMPCGTGACSGCVVPRSDQALPSKICLEGPVFNARSLDWPGLESIQIESVHPVDSDDENACSLSEDHSCQ